MSDMMGIAVSGLRAYQTALTTTSENIANAGTAGYVRRGAAVREVAVPGIGGAGLGVAVNGITRAGDTLRAGEVRNAFTDLSRTNTGIVWLERIEHSLTNDQLGQQITAFFNSARALSADPSSMAPRITMLESASSVAAAFTATSNALAAAHTDLDASAEASVAELNGFAAALAKVNSALSRTMAGTSSSAAMLDERDRLLEKMAGLSDLRIDFDASGRATVHAAGGGPLLVQGGEAGTLTYVRSGGAVSFAVHRGGESFVFAPSGGSLAAIGEAAQRIADASDTLDTLAAEFIEGVNEFQASGQDLAGEYGEPMFTSGARPALIALALTDPRAIAAAGVDGGPRDNSNLAGLEALRGSARFEARLTETTTGNASALSARRLIGDAQAAMYQTAVAARTAATGVNIDEEAVDLLRFQQAYQASSRVVQIARETLQAILDIR